MKTDFKGKWIYWRWKDEHNDAIRKSFVQDFIAGKEDDIFEFADSESWTNYPSRILRSEIKIINI